MDKITQREFIKMTSTTFASISPIDETAEIGLTNENNSKTNKEEIWS